MRILCLFYCFRVMAAGCPILRHKCVICDQEGVNISWDVIRSQLNVLLIKIKSKILPVTSFCYMWIVSSERKAAILKNRPWRAWMTSYHFALLWTWKLRKFHYRLNQFHNFFMISTLFEKIPPCEANYVRHVTSQLSESFLNSWIVGVFSSLSTY